MIRGVALALALAFAPAAARAQEAPPAQPPQAPPDALPPLEPPSGLATAPLANDDGTHLQISFRKSISPGATHYEIWRAPATPETRNLGDVTVTADKGWVRAARVAHEADTVRYTHVDEVPGKAFYIYAVRAVALPEKAADDAAPVALSRYIKIGPERPVADWFNEERLFILFLVIAMLVLLLVFYELAKRNPKKMYIRRIAGIDAMEEAIGRATEMGRPVLYIAGIDQIQDIQTVAGLLILGSVAEMCARYDTQIRVPCTYPMNMIIAEEIVRQGFYNAGRPDAHRPQNIQFISSEQFAFCAGVVGIINREKPATNIYLGRFYAESLVLAEAGYANKSIQIGGTAEITQLPFFIAACDYAVLGEELFAVSAYLSRDPKQLSMLKAADFMKVGLIVLILIGTLLSTLHALGVRVETLAELLHI